MSKINYVVGKDQKVLFENIMRNMGNGCKDENGNLIRGNAFIPLSLLFVDARYQGLRKHTKIAKLIAKWDVRKLGNITVVPHPETCTFAIVDGQGRFIAATELGLDGLFATILLGAPEDPEERLKFEAAFFIAQDDECENLKMYEKHSALVINGDRAASIVQKLCKEYELEVVNVKGQRDAKVLGSYTETYRIARREDGEENLRFIFNIIHNAGWDLVSNGYNRYVMRSFRDIFTAHPKDRIKIEKWLSTEMRKINPIELRANAITKYPKRNADAACTLYLEDVLCEELSLQRFIFSNGEKRIVITAEPAIA